MTPDRAAHVLERRREYLLALLPQAGGARAHVIEREAAALTVAIQLLRTTPT